MIEEASLARYFDLPPAGLEQLSTFFHRRELPRGEHFLTQNSYHPPFAYLQSGYLRVWTETPRREVTQWITTPEYVITDLAALLHGTPARWTITALTDCTLYVMDYADYHRLSRKVIGWDAAERQFLAACFITLEERVLDFLSRTARERYDRFFSEHPELFNAVPLQYLASLLGMTPETLSRIRSSDAS